MYCIIYTAKGIHYVSSEKLKKARIHLIVPSACDREEGLSVLACPGYTQHLDVSLNTRLESAITCILNKFNNQVSTLSEADCAPLFGWTSYNQLNASRENMKEKEFCFLKAF